MSRPRVQIPLSPLLQSGLSFLTCQKGFNFRDFTVCFEKQAISLAFRPILDRVKLQFCAHGFNLVYFTQNLPIAYKLEAKGGAKGGAKTTLIAQNCTFFECRERWELVQRCAHTERDGERRRDACAHTERDNTSRKKTVAKSANSIVAKKGSTKGIWLYT